jgi:hypothetical protein
VPTIAKHVTNLLVLQRTVHIANVETAETQVLLRSLLHVHLHLLGVVDRVAAEFSVLAVALSVFALLVQVTNHLIARNRLAALVERADLHFLGALHVQVGPHEMASDERLAPLSGIVALELDEWALALEVVVQRVGMDSFLASRAGAEDPGGLAVVRQVGGHHLAHPGLAANGTDDHGLGALLLDVLAGVAATHLGSASVGTEDFGKATSLLVAGELGDVADPRALGPGDRALDAKREDVPHGSVVEDSGFVSGQNSQARRAGGLLVQPGGDADGAETVAAGGLSDEAVGDVEAHRAHVSVAITTINKQLRIHDD